MEITFLDDILKERKSATHNISQEKLEKLIESHRLNKNLEASIDDDLLFGSDSDDSFNKDYTIPKETLRKERIIKRDEARFAIEKKKREEERLERLAREKVEKENTERLARQEAERLKKEEEEEEAERLENEQAELLTLHQKQAALDSHRQMAYNESKLANQFKGSLQPDQV